MRSLDDYLSKHGRRSIRHVRLDNGFYLLMPDIAGNHHYTLTSQNITSFGAEGNISAFDPYTGSSTDFSLMQLGLANDDTGQRQSVEAGWQEYQQEYGDWVPHFFVFYTTNGYSEYGDGKGGYDRGCCRMDTIRQHGLPRRRIQSEQHAWWCSVYSVAEISTVQ